MQERDRQLWQLQQEKNVQLSVKDRTIALKDQDIASKDQKIASKDQEIVDITQELQRQMEVSVQLQNSWYFIISCVATKCNLQESANLRKELRKVEERAKQVTS